MYDMPLCLLCPKDWSSPSSNHTRNFKGLLLQWDIQQVSAHHVVETSSRVNSQHASIIGIVPMIITTTSVPKETSQNAYEYRRQYSRNTKLNLALKKLLHNTAMFEIILRHTHAPQKGTTHLNCISKHAKQVCACVSVYVCVCVCVCVLLYVS